MDNDLKKELKVRNVLRVALYVRVSSQEQVEGYSIGEQTERLTKYAEAMGWQIYKVYVDPGYSGGNMDRPGLTEMIKDVEDGKVDTVAVYKLDRLSRSQFDTLFLIEKVFLPNDTDFVSMTENFSTNSPLGRAMIGFLAVFAQLEKDKINERMTMGREARAKLGKWNGGTEPIGYDYVPADDMLYPNDYEQMQLRELRQLFLEGQNLRAIEKIFKEKGYKHKHGVWDPKAMRRVLRSKLYLGYLQYQGVWYKGDHEVTLDRETHEKIVKILDVRAEAYKQSGIRPGAQTTYLGGLLYCKNCGAKYTKTTGKKSKSKPQPIYYSCYSRCNKVKKMVKDPNCKNKNWRMDDLNNLVFDEIRKFALDPEYIRTAQTEGKKDSDQTDKIAIIKKEIGKLDEQISRFMDLYGIGKFTIDQVSKKVDPLNEERNKLEKELESLTSDTAEITIEETIEIVKDLDEILARNDFNEIRMMIELLISYIELDDEDVYIHWKFI
jgi:site-specific DNA recombinase